MAQAQSGSVMPITSEEPQALGATVSKQRLISILIGVLLGMLLAAFDQTIVGTALPRIVSELGGFDQYAWVVTAYLLTSTVSVLTPTSRLGSMRGAVSAWTLTPVVSKVLKPVAVTLRS